MELVDTHCHIQSIGLQKGERSTRELWAKSELDADRVVGDAVDAGVGHMICVGCDLDDSELAIEFSSDRTNCFASIGLHPHEAQHYAGNSQKLQQFASLAANPKVVAVGECGLDFYYNHSPKEAQFEVLKFQIELALKHNLPIIFHVREAFEEFWPLFNNYKGIRGVLHSYTDSADNLSKALENDLFIGVNGIATFAKDENLLAVYKAIPSDRLLLETDAPFLTPAPHRGKINQPKRLVSVAEFLADLRGENQADLAKATTANAHKLFGI